VAWEVANHADSSRVNRKIADITGWFSGENDYFQLLEFKRKSIG
jgi:hypothetical protein